jgi:hypothetical protein
MITARDKKGKRVKKSEKQGNAKCESNIGNEKPIEKYSDREEQLG